MQKINKIMLFSKNNKNIDVPDPRFGDDEGFQVVFDLLKDSCACFLEHLI